VVIAITMVEVGYKKYMVFLKQR